MRVVERLADVAQSFSRLRFRTTIELQIEELTKRLVHGKKQPRNKLLPLTGWPATSGCTVAELPAQQKMRPI